MFFQSVLTLLAYVLAVHDSVILRCSCAATLSLMVVQKMGTDFFIRLSLIIPERNLLRLTSNYLNFCELIIQATQVALFGLSRALTATPQAQVDIMRAMEFFLLALLIAYKIYDTLANYPYSNAVTFHTSLLANSVALFLLLTAFVHYSVHLLSADHLFLFQIALLPLLAKTVSIYADRAYYLELFSERAESYPLAKIQWRIGKMISSKGRLVREQGTLFKLSAYFLHHRSRCDAAECECKAWDRRVFSLMNAEYQRLSPTHFLKPNLLLVIKLIQIDLSILYRKLQQQKGIDRSLFYFHYFYLMTEVNQPLVSLQQLYQLMAGGQRSSYQQTLDFVTQMHVLQLQAHIKNMVQMRFVEINLHNKQQISHINHSIQQYIQFQDNNFH